jgi:candicidin polyketide synthase FscE
VAGIVKLVLSLQHERLPKTLFSEDPTPHVDWSAGTVRLLDAPVDWRRGVRPRRAGVSAFGIGGTNAHLILEESPHPEETPIETAAAGHALPFVLSARNDGALRAGAQRLRDHLSGAPAPPDVHLAYSLATTRAALDVRCVVIAASHDELLERIDDVACGRSHPSVISGRTAARGKLVAMFSGQGSQRAGAGRDLYEQSAPFRAELDDVLAHFDGPNGAAIREAMFAREGSPEALLLDRTEYAQPALFALQVALLRLLERWGVAPDILMGHSVGEIAVAHAAGVLSLRDACTLVAARGRLMQALPEGGAMYAVEADEMEIAEDLSAECGVSLAAVNGERSLVLSGDVTTVAAIAEDLATRGRRTRRLHVSHAFHSARMAPMLEEFERVIGGLSLQPSRRAIVSTLTGDLVEPGALADAEYWKRHARETVRFYPAVMRAKSLGASTYLEIGPTPVLSALVEEADPDASVWPVLRSGDEATSLTRAVGGVFAAGGKVDFDAFFLPLAPRAAALPTYAFQRRRFWPESVAAAIPERPSLQVPRLDAPLWDAAAVGDLDALGAKLGATTALQREALAQVVPLLAAWRSSTRAREALDSMRYAIEWKRIGTRSRPMTGVWLLVSGARERSLGDPVAAALARRGAEVVRLEGCGEEELASALASNLAGVVMLATDVAPIAGPESVPSCLANLIAVSKACRRARASARLWVVTRGAVSTGSEDAPPSPEMAMVWGLGRVVSLERPEEWGGLVDLDGGPPTRRSFDGLAEALSVEDAEDELAVREDGLRVRRLVRFPSGEVVAGASYAGTALVTGGTGALGAHVARFLAQRGARHIVLTSRRGHAAEGAQALRHEIESLGAKCTIAAVDVADRLALERVFASLDADHEELTTVVHAAGVNDMTPVDRLDPARVLAVVEAKVRGAQHLDELLRDRPSTRLVLFASGAGIWGSGGQGAYACANAYLDALAQRRKAQGRPTTSMAWGIWGGDGMASSLIEHFRQRGLRPLDPKVAIQAMDQAIAEGAANVTFADFDWAPFAAAYGAARERPLIAEFAPAVEPKIEGQGNGQSATEFVRRLRSASGSIAYRPILLAVCEATAGVLGVSPGDVHPEKPLKELGMDSLMAVRLRNRLSELTGMRLPATLLFNYPDPAALAGYLQQALAPADRGPDSSSLMVELDRLETMPIADIDFDVRSALGAKLESLARKWNVPRVPAVPVSLQGRVAEDVVLFGNANDEQLFRLVDESIGQ